MHSAQEMSDLVNDVDRYVEFLPWCGESSVVSRDQDEMVASITIAFKGIRKSFTTRNRLIGCEKTVMTLIDGPFSELSGFWTYRPLEPNTSKICLRLEFDFSNPLVARVVGPVFKGIADSMVKSFCKRADQLYL